MAYDIPTILARMLAKKRAANLTGSHGQKVKLDCRPADQQHNRHTTGSTFHEARPLQKAALPAEPNIERVARQYMLSQGMTPNDSPLDYQKIDEPRAREVAGLYEAAKHDPSHPDVRASYDALKRETLAQFDHLLKSGYKLSPWQREGQPYRNSDEMSRDVHNNRHLAFFTGGDMPPDHPLAEQTGRMVNGVPLTYNDAFRAVHDVFGHAHHGNQFGPRGEEHAWRAHSRMFSEAARPAMTAETKGQNSWVNFGPHSSKPVTERPYAQQKATTMKLARRALMLIRKSAEGTSGVPRPPKREKSPLAKRIERAAEAKTASETVTTGETPASPTDGLPSLPSPTSQPVRGKQVDALGRQRTAKQSVAFFQKLNEKRKAQKSVAAPASSVDPTGRIAAATRKIQVGEPEPDQVPAISWVPRNGISSDHLTPAEKAYHGPKALGKVSQHLEKMVPPESLVPAIRAGATMHDWYPMKTAFFEALFPTKKKERGILATAAPTFSPQTSPSDEIAMAMDLHRLRKIGAVHHETGDRYANRHKDPLVHDRFSQDYGAGRLHFPEGHPHAGTPIVRRGLKAQGETSGNKIRYGDQWLPTGPLGLFNTYNANERVHGTTQFHGIAHRGDVLGLLAGGLKTDNYRNNGLGNQNAVTSDVWHLRNLGLPEYYHNKIKAGDLEGLPDRVKALAASGNHWLASDTMAKALAAKPDSYLATVAHTRRQAELAGVTPSAAQSAPWGVLRAVHTLVPKFGWDAEKIAAGMTHRDVFDSSGFLPVIASNDILHRVKVGEKEGVYEPGAHKRVIELIKKNWPKDELLNQKVQAEGTKELLPYVERAMAMAAKFALDPETLKKAMKDAKLRYSVQPTSQPVHLKRKTSMPFSEDFSVKLARNALGLIRKSGLSAPGSTKPPPFQAPPGEPAPGSTKDVQHGGNFNPGSPLSGQLRDRGSFVRGEPHNPRAYTAGSSKPEPTPVGSVKKAAEASPGRPIGLGGIKVKRSPLRASGPFAERDTHHSLSDIAKRTGHGEQSLHDRLSKGPQDIGGYRYELVKKAAGEAKPTPRMKHSGEFHPVAPLKPGPSGPVGEVKPNVSKPAPSYPAPPAAAPAQKPKPSVGYGYNPQGVPGTDGTYRKPKDLYDPNKVDRGPTELRSGPKTELPAKQPGPQRVPAGRHGYKEKNQDGSWDFVYSNTGRRVPLGTEADYQKKQQEVADRRAAGRPGSRNISARGLYRQVAGGPDTSRDKPGMPFKPSENTAGNLIPSVVGGVVNAVADPRGTWEGLRTGWHLLTGDDKAAKDSMQRAAERKAGSAK